MVINSGLIENAKRAISSAKDITTKQLLNESMKDTSSLYYITAVVNASQYIPNHRMKYYLGAGDSTTDAEGHTFHNRELREDLSYFFRVYSVNSTSEVCRIYSERCCVYLVCLLFRMRFQLLLVLSVSTIVML